MKTKKKQYAAYFIGLLFYAFGACLNTRAKLGVTAITSVSYVYAEISGKSLGTTMLVYNIIVVLAERLIFGKAFDRKKYLQIPLSCVFSVFIDLCMSTVSWIQTDHLWMQILVFAAAMPIMGIGIAMTIYGDVMVLPAEGLVQAMVYRFDLEFGRAKIMHDCMLVVITVVSSLIGLGYLYGIHVGTIAAALILGPLTRSFLKLLQKL